MSGEGEKAPKKGGRGRGGFSFAVLLVVALSIVFCKRPDFFIVLIPKYYDGHFVRYLYNFGTNKVNSGVTHVPLLSSIIPTVISKENLKDILAPSGYPQLVKKMITVDQDTILQKVSNGNKGKPMRMLSFESYKDAHFSPSCGQTSIDRTLKNFDDFASDHLFSNVAHNHSHLYAGFEAITDPVIIEDITGLDLKVLGDYRQNNLFTSNLPREIVTAPMHCAPIDSVAIQLLGTKTWFFVSPDDLAAIPNIPMPTAFNLPMTDDELLSKVNKIIVVKQEPGDVLYFGPHWCHVVSTSPGPNLMFNMRYNAVPKIHKGPLSLAGKILLRMATRKMGGLPQDNKDEFPIIFGDLNRFFSNCGPSEFFNSMLKTLNLV